MSKHSCAKSNLYKYPPATFFVQVCNCTQAEANNSDYPPCIQQQLTAFPVQNVHSMQRYMAVLCLGLCCIAVTFKNNRKENNKKIRYSLHMGLGPCLFQWVFVICGETGRRCQKAPLGFEPRISCLLDRRFNHLSHGAGRRRSANSPSWPINRGGYGFLEAIFCFNGCIDKPQVYVHRPFYVPIFTRRFIFLF